MIPGLQRAQANHDAELPPYYFTADETTEADALRYSWSKAAKAAELYVDSCEVTIEQCEGGECVVQLSLWPCRSTTKRQQADALVAAVACLLAAASPEEQR